MYDTWLHKLKYSPSTRDRHHCCKGRAKKILPDFPESTVWDRLLVARVAASKLRRVEIFLALA